MTDADAIRLAFTSSNCLWPYDATRAAIASRCIHTARFRSLAAGYAPSMALQGTPHKVELNGDFSDLLRAFSNAGVEFLVVGAHALGVHDRARATKGLDVWIRPSAENARRAWQALADFGAPLGGLHVEDLHDEDTVLQIGVAPIRIDVITSIEGVSFDEAWPNRVEIERDGITVCVIGARDLIRNKEAAGRPQDLLDAAMLRKRLGSDS